MDEPQIRIKCRKSNHNTTKKMQNINYDIINGFQKVSTNKVYSIKFLQIYNAVIAVADVNTNSNGERCDPVWASIIVTKYNDIQNDPAEI